MKRLLCLLPFTFPVKSFAGSGGASDEVIFIAYLVGILLVLLAVFELPRTIKKLRLRLSEKKRMRQERLEAEKHIEENHYFAGT
jgi:hypothetical protein